MVMQKIPDYYWETLLLKEDSYGLAFLDSQFIFSWIIWLVITNGGNIGHSYISDWFRFWLFYKYYKSVAQT